MPYPLPDPLPKETRERMFTAWRKPADHSENLLIISAPYMDRAYRIPEFVLWLGSGYHTHVVSLVGDKIEDSNDWEIIVGQLARNGRGKRVCVISDAEHLLTDQHHVLQSLSEWHIRTKSH